MTEEEKFTTEGSVAESHGARKHKASPKRKVRKVVHEERRTLRHETHKAEGKPIDISLQTMLAVVLVLSLLLNMYQFFQVGSLKTDIEGLRKVIEVSGGTTGTTIPVPATVPYTGEKVKLDFYVMSQCPYGTQVVDAIAPVVKQFGGALELTIDYIASDNGDGTYQSLHGQNEVLGDIVQLCAMKYEPAKYLDMFVCMNKNAQQIPDNWQSCAQQSGMNVVAIKTCYDGAEGKTLMSASIKKAVDAKASGSPTIYLNGVLYSGGRTSSEFLRAACNVLTTKPEACKNLPAAAKVNVIALSDARCGADCDMSSLLSQLQSIFPGLVVKELDYSTAEGKRLFDSSNITALPALLFDETVKNGEGYSSVSRYLENAGKYYSLRIGSAWDPYCDATSEHCGEDKCKSRISCRPEIPGKLDVFVMSQCPYGTMALDAMKEVLNAFKGQINFSVNYIATETSPGVFDSLHGDQETQEDIRELCAMKYYQANYKFMDYIWCRNKDITSTAWESCATGNGMDAAKIKACAEGAEGKKLLSDNIKAAEQLSIGGSPTFLANNKRMFNAINAASIQSSICASNPGLGGCSKTLNGTSAADQSGSAASGGSC
ncbi:MAG: DsbA family protein [Candidatus Altiarchaeota archaeon]|nr:DsbA family protein [Candidatus Altiarchaeota archaeon]